MASKTTLQLFRNNRTRIAHAVAAQIQNSVPRYQHVERQALTANADTLLEGVELLLASGDDRTLMEALGVIMRLRQVSGFSIEDFLVAVLCALPVLRRFYLSHCTYVEEGLKSYEEVEAAMIPLYGQAMAGFARMAEEADTLPGQRSPLLPFEEEEETATMLAFDIVPVVPLSMDFLDDGSDDLTRPCDSPWKDPSDC